MLGTARACKEKTIYSSLRGSNSQLSDRVGAPTRAALDRDPPGGFAGLHWTRTPPMHGDPRFIESLSRPTDDADIAV